MATDKVSVKDRNELVRMPTTLKDIPIGKMRVSNAAQRELRPHRVTELLANFDPEMLGYVVVSMRDGTPHIVDGNHRVEALKQWLGEGYEKQMLTCRVYTGLTEAQEAKLFLILNNQLTVSIFDKFKVGVTAGNADEMAVKHVVDKAGLRVSLSKNEEGTISGVATLLRIYRRSDAANLARTIKIAHSSFGDPGLLSVVLDGVARVCERYNGALDDGAAIERMSTMRGGVGALVNKAQQLRKQTGLGVGECVAAAMVDTLNAKSGAKKLPSWWKQG